MAAFNEIQVGRINGLLHKLLNMKEGAPAPQLAGDVVPILNVEAGYRPEYEFLQGSRIATGSARATGSVGNTSYAEMYNTPASGVLAVIEHVIVWLDTSDNIKMGWRNNTSLTPGTSIPATQGSRESRDNRSQAVANESCLLKVANPPGNQITNIVFRLPQNNLTQYDYPLNIVLAPGETWQIQNYTANIELQTQWFWRERTLEPSETR